MSTQPNFPKNTGLTTNANSSVTIEDLYNVDPDYQSTGEDKMVISNSTSTLDKSITLNDLTLETVLTWPQSPTDAMDGGVDPDPDPGEKYKLFYYFAGLSELNQYSGKELNTTSSTIEDINFALPSRSQLIHYVPAGAGSSFPTSPGILEIQKQSDSTSLLLFTSNDNRIWRGSISNSIWSDWKTDSSTSPIGSISYFAGNTTPLGWLFCNGQAISRLTYSGLFEVIGTLYGNGNGSTTFNVPDCRGRFIRSLNVSNNGIDPNRLLGSDQSEGLPNITGMISTGYWPPVCGIQSSGAFQISGAQQYYQGYSSGSDPLNNYWFDASKSNSIYGSSTEVRPSNIAFNTIIKY